MGISNLTSSIRGVSGTEKILNILKLETDVLVAGNASIAGVNMGATLNLSHVNTVTASLNQAKMILVASTGGTQSVLMVNASRTGTLTGSGGITGQETYMEASVSMGGQTLGMTAIYGQSTLKAGTMLWENAGFTYSKVEGGTANYAYGHEAWLEVDGGTITTGYGFHTYIAQTSGTFTNANGFSADIDGTIGVVKGVNLDLTDASSTNVYGLFIDGDAKNYLSGNLQVEGGVITVGSVDAVTGAIVLFGDGDQTGGRITIQSGANLDATINSYTVLVGQDDLRIGPAANASALMYRGLDDVWVMNAPFYAASGTLDVGISDLRRGMVTLYGDAVGSTGGTIRMHIASPLSDGTRKWYEVNVYESMLLLGDNVAPTERVAIDGNTLIVRSGALEVGESDLKAGVITVQSDGAGQVNGGAMSMLVAPDFDTNDQSYHIQVVGSNLRIGPNNDAQALIYDGDRDGWDFKTGAVSLGRGAGYINMNASFGRLGYGIRDNSGIMQFKNSTGTWANIT